MPSRYFYLRGTEQQGPVDEAELQRLAAAGAVRPDTLIWREGTPDWVEAGAMSGLFTDAADSVDSPPPLPASGSRGSMAAAAEWGRAAAREASETARVTAAQIHRLVGLGSARWQDHRLSREAVAAQAEFGRRLYEAGLGDGELRNRLTQLDEQIASLEWTRSSTREAEAERRGLLVRLAAPYLHEPPPGLEPEQIRAREALAAEQAAHDRAMREQAGLLPADRPQRRRLAIGAGVLALSVLIAVWLFCVGLGGGWLGDDEHPSILVGQWEGKTEWIITFTTRIEFQQGGRVFWHQDFGAIAPKNDGSGTWRIKRVEGDRYTLEMVSNLDPDETRGWVIAFNGEDEFTVTGFDEIPITVRRRK